MNFKRWALATVGTFVVIFGMEFAIHHCWLSEFYKAHAQWWRPEAEMQSLMPFMLLSQLALAALLPVVYAQGYEKGKGSVSQGARFGLVIGLLLLLPNSLMTYCLYPYPASLIQSWFISGLIEFTLTGIVIGALYQPSS